MNLNGFAPQVGPVLLVIPGISGVQLAPATTGAEVQYRWPRPYLLKSWIVVPTSGLEADAGKLRVRMRDQMGVELVTDTVQINADANFLPVVAQTGIAPVRFNAASWWAPNWTPMRRIVQAGEVWRFQAMNVGAGAITPFFAFELAEPAPQAIKIPYPKQAIT